MTFTWNDEKAAANEAKHGVRFEDAQDAFYDPQAVITAREMTKREKRFYYED